MPNMETQPVTPGWETSQPVPSKRRRNIGGRPKKLPEQLARFRLYPCFTEHQYQRLQERAEAAGLTEVELIRRLSLELPLGKILPAPSREALTLLSNATNNLNQIARRLNAYDETECNKIIIAITETREAIEKMGAGLYD